MSAARHALIIGGSRGLGRALAERWSSQGRRVSVIARKAAEVVEPHAWSGWSADLRDAAGLRGVLDQILTTAGPVDDLVFTQRSRQAGGEWQDEIATSLTATTIVMQALESHWSLAQRPSVILTVSLAGRMVALEQNAAYHAAKAGLEQLTRYYAVALAPLGVRVNAVAPGVIRSERQDLAASAPKQTAQRLAIPLGRLAEQSDVCHAIDFLCSEGAAYITGQTLVVDGGLSLIMQHSLAARIAAAALDQATSLMTKDRS